MRNNTRMKRYEYIKKRDGEKCFICNKKGNPDTLYIDFWDGDKKNIHPDNLHLLCKSCDQKKDGSNGINCLPSRNVLSTQTSSAEFEKNQYSEPRFRHWLFFFLRTNGPQMLDEIINAGAEVSSCSIITIKRYIAKCTSSVGWAQQYIETSTDEVFISLKAKNISIKSCAK